MNASREGHFAPGVTSLVGAQTHSGDYVYEGDYAAWTQRVIATLLDTALVSALAIALYGPGASLTTLPLFDSNLGDGPAIASSGWRTLAIIFAFLALAACQGYLGATPGKRAMGIVVVGDATGKPIGLSATILRWLAHFLDAIFLIGYLRPLWHRQEKTFADSLLHTVVVKGPLPARFGAHAGDVPNPRKESRAITLVLVQWFFAWARAIRLNHCLGSRVCRRRLPPAKTSVSGSVKWICV